MKTSLFEKGRLMHIICKYCGYKYEDWIKNGQLECNAGYSSHRFLDKFEIEKEKLEELKVGKEKVKE